MIAFVRAHRRRAALAAAMTIALATALIATRHAANVQRSLAGQNPFAFMPEAMLAEARAPLPADVAAAPAVEQFRANADLPKPVQLLRTARLDVRVNDVSKQLDAAAAIAQSQGGDIISLNDEVPDASWQAHVGNIILRVPQARFEGTLHLLGALGRIESQSVNAQDASDQLVDLSARLRNLRRTEADMLAIMDRSGNIEQVLDVTEQVSGVRDQIERLAAQLATMKHQVAYSTITVTLHSPAVVAAPSSRRILADAWRFAVASLREVTLTLLTLGLWLVAFSPYFAVLALACVVLVRRLRGKPAV